MGFIISDCFDENLYIFAKRIRTPSWLLKFEKKESKENASWENDAPTHQRSEIFQIPSGAGETIEWSIGDSSEISLILWLKRFRAHKDVPS